MSCERYDRELALQVAGDLQEREGARLARHLEDCARCRAFLAALAESQQAVTDLAREPLADAALETVRERVLASFRETRSTPRRRWAPAWRWGFAASLAGIVGVGTLLWRTGQDGPRGAPDRPSEVADGVAPDSTNRESATPPPSRSATVTEIQALRPVDGEASQGTQHGELAASGSEARAESGSTRRPVRRVSLDMRPADAVPALSPEDAEQLARAVVAVSRIRRLSDPEGPKDARTFTPGLVVLATADPDVVIYWQLDSSGG